MSYPPTGSLFQHSHLLTKPMRCDGIHIKTLDIKHRFDIIIRYKERGALLRHPGKNMTILGGAPRGEKPS